MTRVEVRSGGAVVVYGPLSSRFQVESHGERQGWCVRDEQADVERPPAQVAESGIAPER